MRILIPLGAALTHHEARTFAEVIARLVVADLLEIATAARPLAERGSKVYVDFLQNGRGKTIAAPFSARPRRGAPVSLPLRWSQVTKRLSPAAFTIKTAAAILRDKGDPMAAVLGQRVDVARVLAGLRQRVGRWGPRSGPGPISAPGRSPGGFPVPGAPSQGPGTGE